MPSRVDRRRFIGQSFAAAAALGGISPTASSAEATTAAPAAPAGPAAPAPVEGATGLSTYELGPHLWIRWNNRTVTSYRAHRSQKYPYLFPLAGPASGLSLTSESTLPFPHHRSAWFGCDRVNGSNFWQEDLDRGQILSSGPTWGARTANSVEIRDACDWQRPGGPRVMTDRRSITLRVVSPQRHEIDWDLTWSAAIDITIPQTNHSLFSIRAAPELTPSGGGRLFNAEGDTGEKGTYGKPSAWCAFHGPRPGGVEEGIALFDHPANPWAPCPWFTRDYGFLSPTPLYFRKDPWRLAAGQSVRLRYRLVLFSGPRDPLPAWYQEWTSAA